MQPSTAQTKLSLDRLVNAGPVVSTALFKGFTIAVLGTVGTQSEWYRYRISSDDPFDVVTSLHRFHSPGAAVSAAMDDLQQATDEDFEKVEAWIESNRRPLLPMSRRPVCEGCGCAMENDPTDHAGLNNEHYQLDSWTCRNCEVSK